MPGYHSARYAGTARVRQGTRGIVNPISVPGIMAAPGLALENWSGSEDAAAPWLERLIALAGRPEPDALDDVRPARRRSRRRPARAAVRPAQPRHARPAARFVSGPAVVRRDLRARPRCRRRRPRRSPRCTPPRRCARRSRTRSARWHRAATRTTAATADATARGRAIFAERIVGNDRQPPDLQARAARLRRGEDRRAGAGADRSDEAAGREAAGALRRLSLGRAARDRAAARREPAAARAMLALPRRRTCASTEWRRPSPRPSPRRAGEG